MTWIHNNEEFTDPQDYWGFVYEIENTITGRKYIGKKFFTKSKTKQKNGKKKRLRVDSGWIDYWGSSSSLLSDIEQTGKEFFKRTILYLCRTKAECSYFESYEIFTRQALIDPLYYNDWVSCRIRKAHLTKLQLPIDKLFLS